jgi:hypothetical protein
MFNITGIIMHKPFAATASLRYLAKVLLSLAALALWAAAAICLPTVAITSPWREVTVIALVLAVLALPSLAHRQVGRADELRRAIHQLACTRSLPWLAAACGALGVLQANDLIPLFNQLWMLGLLIATWGLQLMLADRPHH